jgi:HEAT repeat protein
VVFFWSKRLLRETTKELLKYRYGEKEIMASFEGITNMRTIFTLVSILGDEEVGAKAAIILGRIKSPKSFSPLMDALTTGNPNARRNAAWVLGELGDQRAVPALIEILKNKYMDVNLLRNVAQALGKLKSESSIIPLIKALENKNIRWNVAQALGEIKSKEVLRLLLNNINHKDRGVRLGVVWALRILRSEEALIPLVKALDDPDEEVAKGAAWALRQFPSERALNKLALEFVKSSSNTRNHLIYILKKFGNRNTIRTLRELSENASPEVRYDIERAIKAIKNR